MSTEHHALAQYTNCHEKKKSCKMWKLQIIQYHFIGKNVVQVVFCFKYISCNKVVLTIAKDLKKVEERIILNYKCQWHKTKHYLWKIFNPNTIQWFTNVLRGTVVLRSLQCSSTCAFLIFTLLLNIVFVCKMKSGWIWHHYDIHLNRNFISDPTVCMKKRLS